jgi:hypothetical protein
MRSLLLALAAAMVTILATPAAIQASPSTRPFTGSMSGTATFVPDSGCLLGLRTDTAATGRASHIGRFTYTSSHCSAITFAGAQTMVAANGDKIFADYESIGPPVFPPSEIGTVYEIPTAFMITGGTGRFADATGGGIMTAHITFMGFGAPVWPITFEWSGTIGY